jgi:hypothetical protein
LYEKQLEDSKLQFLNNFIDDYLDLKTKHFEGNSDKKALTKLLLYEMVLPIGNDNIYGDILKDDYPAFKIIEDKLTAYNNTIEDKFARVRKVEPNNKGFAPIVLIVGATIILGILLGSLLWFIR